MKIDKVLFFLTAFSILIFSANGYAQDSLNFTLLGRGLPGECNATFVQDTFAYVGAGDVLMIFDIADPAHPFPVANLPLNGKSGDIIEDLHVSNGRAFIAFDQSGLEIVDVSSPSSPVELGSLKFTGYAYGIYASGNYAYVCGDYGMHIVDVSVPSSPQEVSFFPVQSPWAALNVQVQDTFAYLAASYGGLYILNIKDPANPVQVSSVDRFGVWVYEVKVVGNWLYMAYSGEGGDGFEIFDITNRALPASRGSLQTSTTTRRLDVYGKFAYLAVSDSGFLVIDIRDKYFPSVTGRWNRGYGQNIFFYSDKYGEKVCVSSEYEGLHIIDVTYPDSPVELSHYDTHSFSQDVTTSPDGRYAYVVEQPSALKVLDMSNLRVPVTVFDTLFFPGNVLYGGYGVCSGVSIAGNRLYVGEFDFFGGENAFLVFDLTNPAHPKFQGKYSYGYAGVRGHVVKDTIAFLATSDGVILVSVADAKNPHFLNYFNVPGVWDFPYGMDLKGGYLYLSSGTSGLRILNISRPDSLKEEGFSVPADGCVDAMAVSACGDLALVADYQDGLRVVDVSSPWSPSEIGFYNPAPCTPQCMDVKVFTDQGSCKYAFAAFASTGLEVLDLANPSSPNHVGHYFTENPRRLHLRGDTLFVADRLRGLYILKVSSTTAVVEEPGVQPVPKTYSLFQNYPNPFNMQTEIGYDLPAGALVSLEVFNLLGQKVTTLVNEYQTSGRKKITWNGKDSEGIGVASGIYFYKLKTGEFAQTRKMVLLK